MEVEAKMILILCVDGLDTKKIDELNLSMDHNLKFAIPLECCVYDNGVYDPHTLKIWPTIFTGRFMTEDIRPSKNRSLIKKIIAGLHYIGRKIENKKSMPYPFTYPFYINEENLFNKYDSFHWNIPTFSIDYLFYNYGWMPYKKFIRREFEIFNLLAYSSIYTDYDIYAIYTRLLDVFGHYKMNTDFYYNKIFSLIELLKDKTKIILLSDHGTEYETGLHTWEIYMGSNVPIEGESILDIRKNIEGLIR